MTNDQTQATSHVFFPTPHQFSVFTHRWGRYNVTRDAEGGKKNTTQHIMQM